MGGLKPEIAEGIRMFKPQSLKEAISLDRMKDEQMKRHRQFLRPTQVNRMPLTLPTTTRATPNAPFRRLPWEEMQKQVTEEADAKEVTRENDEPEITLHALTGWSAPRTMRVDAKVGFFNAVVLIDNGSTHNFISTRMADQLRLPVVPTETFTVWVANGARLQCQGKFEKPIQAASLKEISKEFHQGHSVFAICPQSTMQDTEEIQSSSMCQVLAKYSEIFDEPTQLPPKCEIDHTISLKEGIEPVNVRPYRYAYFQKAEIEKQVQEMLNSRLIRPSTITIKDRFSIPTVEDMLDELYGATYFTKLDLRAGYHQVRVQPSNIHKTAFRTHNGHYEYLVMPFGLRVKVDSNKIEAMVAWPRPANISELRGFLGLTGYYRKFVRNYGLIARALTNLLKKGQFGWNAEAKEAFQTLKKAMTITPILAMPNFNDTFIVETDASGNGIGAVLQQQGKPIAFMSRALGVSKCSWSTYAKEMLAVVEAIQQQKWVAKLLGYDYEIQYRPGHENSVADALSRRLANPTLHNLFVPQLAIWEEIKHAATTDDYMAVVSNLVQTQLEGPFTARNGLFFFKGRIVVPSDVTLRNKLIYESHDTKIGGHSGILRTFKKVYSNLGLSHVRLSKYAHFMSLSHPFTAKVVADKFVKGVVKLHGMPRSIISDRDPIFISKFWQEFFTMSGTKLKMSSAYHPQTDGQSEVVNRCLEQYLRSFVHQWPRKWHSFLHWAELWYNTTFHASTEGDMVFLRLQPYRQSSAFKRAHQKLASKFFGPYPILQQGGKFITESLVQWKHLPPEDATWELTEFLCQQFPNLNLEDKVPLSGRGIDKPPRRSERATKPNPKYSEVQ
ncbi:hypothetical protein D5086_008960 [Populus alba]|uniref:Uncharacterized protein n=1 Tax=Populus alba TaxID=43335 RepID=A0ACC4CGY2_POPAL